MYEQARRSSPPNRVRYPTDRPTIRLRLLPTLLRSNAVTFGYGVVAFSGMDFHHAIVAPSWAHSYPRKRVSIVRVARTGIQENQKLLIRSWTE